jgi:hypothetical protein
MSPYENAGNNLLACGRSVNCPGEMYVLLPRCMCVKRLELRVVPDLDAIDVKGIYDIASTVWNIKKR